MTKLSKFVPKSVPPILLIGVVGSGVAVLFHHAINFIHHSLWFPLSNGNFQSFLITGFIVLTLVGLANGWLLSHFAPEAAGSGIPQLKTAYRRNRGQISFRIVWVKFIAATLSVGGGLSLGREGPSVQLAGGLASIIGQQLKLSHFRIRTLTACAGLLFVPHSMDTIPGIDSWRAGNFFSISPICSEDACSLNLRQTIWRIPLLTGLDSSV